MVVGCWFSRSKDSSIFIVKLWWFILVKKYFVFLMIIFLSIVPRPLHNSTHKKGIKEMSLRALDTYQPPDNLLIITWFTRTEIYRSLTSHLTFPSHGPLNMRVVLLPPVSSGWEGGDLIIIQGVGQSLLDVRLSKSLTLNPIEISLIWLSSEQVWYLYPSIRAREESTTERYNNIIVECAAIFEELVIRFGPPGKTLLADDV